MKLALLVFAIAPAFGATDPALIHARDAQNRADLDRIEAAARQAAQKSPKDAAAQFRYALACSYTAEVAQEVHDKNGAKRAALDGIPAAESLTALDPNNGEYWRLLGTLYGQAIQDFFTAFQYGKRAQEALNKAKELNPKSSEVWVSDAVGRYYLPAQFGGGADPAIASLKKATDLDPKNADAWLWLGVVQRKKGNDSEARKSFEKAIALDPARLWAKQQLDKTPK